MKKILPCMIVFVLVQFYAVAQSIGIGTVSPHGSAILDISSTSKGLLIPRMTSAERSGIATPAPGLMIYDLNTESLWINTSDGWVNMNDFGTPGWQLTGNNGSNPSTNFIGTTDNQSLMFKVNNQPYGMLCNNQSVFWGDQAGINNTGFSNIAIGAKALYNNTNKTNLVAIGDSALYNNSLGAITNTQGSANTALGSKALYSNTIGAQNTATGFSTMYSNTIGYNNTANGYDALYFNSTGNQNTAIGESALFGNHEGSYNTAIGALAMSSSPGSNGTAVGYEAMMTFKTISEPFINYNVAVGYEALRGPNIGSTGNYNTATGYASLANNKTGNSNTATGYFTLLDNHSGNMNTAIGYQVLESNYTGSGNTGCGHLAVLSNTNGNNNSGFGKNAFFVNNSLDNTTCIGYNSGGNVNASNRVEIGNTSVSWIGGQQTWSTYSDGRIKDNVAADVPGLDFITLLRPVTYNLNIHRQNEMVYAGRKEEEEWPTKYDVEQIRTTGFIAQEVAQAANEAGYDFSGVEIPKDPNELYSLRYSDFVVPLVKAVQEQQEMIESQQAIIQAQQQLLEDIQNQLQALKANE